MGYPGENRRLSEDTVSTLERHHAFLQQFRADLAGSLKHEKATGWLSRRSKGENSLLSRINKVNSKYGGWSGSLSMRLVGDGATTAVRRSRALSKKFDHRNRI